MAKEKEKKVKKQNDKVGIPKNNGVSPENLDKLSRQELIEIAKNLQIKNYSRLSKASLLKEISKTRKSNQEEKVKVVKVDKDKPESVKKDEIKTKESELGLLSRQSLVDKAKDLKVKNYSRLSKQELVKSIIETDNVEEVSEIKEKSVSVTKDPVLTKTEELEETKVIAETETTDGSKDLESLSRQELVEIAQELKIKNYSRLNKTRLLKLISEAKESKDKKDKPKALSKSEKPAKVVKEEPEEEKVEEQADEIDKIGKGLELPYGDKREQKAIEDEIKSKILYKPSKFPLSKINKEYLLEDEENINLPDLYEEDKITLLPIDPFRVYTYWNFSTETLNFINRMNLNQLLLKVNDVTGIIYNGYNANKFWFEPCIPMSKNWYIFLLDGDVNLCIEIGYATSDGKFSAIAKSNTVFVPRSRPSSFVNDRFVVVSYPDAETKALNAQFEKANSVYLSRTPSKKDKPYYGFESYKPETPKLTKKMPIFIPEHFVGEYAMTGFIPEQKQDFVTVSPPPKLPVLPHSPEIQEQYFEDIQKEVEPVFHKPYIEPQKKESEVFVPTEAMEEKFNIPEEVLYSEYEIIPGLDFKNARVIDRYYYELPGDQKVYRVFYEWTEEGTPIIYKKEIFWVSDVVPKIHENIYRISWGPVWVKEFVGGSERIKYIGASERFLGGSERFLGGSEWYQGGSERYLGGSEWYQGGSERYLGGSEEMYSGGSERYLGGSEWRFYPISDRRFLGGSERFPRDFRFIGGSEGLGYGI